MDRTIASDVAAIGRIAAVPTILEAVLRTTGMRFAAVARVTETHWTACAVQDLINFGLKAGGELVLESTICNEIRQHRQPVAIGNVSADPEFACHHTPAQYGFQSYISLPITLSDGTFFGTLCALDPQPAPIDAFMVSTLQLFADLIASQLEADERQRRNEQALLEAQAVATLREQFVAVLGHDLRTPLQAIGMGAELLARVPLDERSTRAVKVIRSSYERMAELVSNVMDFAHASLGSGIPLVVERCDGALVHHLSQVVEEVRAVHATRQIHARIQLPQPLACDRHRLGQLLGNLVSNAVTHGDATSDVRVEAGMEDRVFELSVWNGGSPIAQADLPRLFQPFSRSQAPGASHGLGLGLYIAAEIARAHGGTLQVESTETSGTRFFFRMPVDALEPRVGAR